jgi:hypothetical protein
MPQIEFQAEVRVETRVVANISNTLDITARAARILGEGNIYDPPNLVELRRIGIIGRSAELKMP